MKKKMSTLVKRGRGRPRKEEAAPQKAVPADQPASTIREVPAADKKGSKRAYNRACQIIIALCEKLRDGVDDETDPLWDELAQCRKESSKEDNAVIGMLIKSLSGGIDVEIDEATPDWG